MRHNTTIHATGTLGSVWWLIDQVAAHGPSWNLVPPIIFGLASLVGAVNAYLDGRQQRRHREEERLGKFLPGIKAWRPLDPKPNSR